VVRRLAIRSDSSAHLAKQIHPAAGWSLHPGRRSRGLVSRTPGPGYWTPAGNTGFELWWSAWSQLLGLPYTPGRQWFEAWKSCMVLEYLSGFSKKTLSSHSRALHLVPTLSWHHTDTLSGWNQYQLYDSATQSSRLPGTDVKCIGPELTVELTAIADASPLYSGVLIMFFFPELAKVRFIPCRIATNVHVGTG